MISNIAVSVVQLGMSCFEVLIDTLELYPQSRAGNADQLSGRTNNLHRPDDDYTTSSHPLHPAASDSVPTSIARVSSNGDQRTHIAQDNYEDASIQSTQPDAFEEQVKVICHILLFASFSLTSRPLNTLSSSTQTLF